VTDLFVIIEVGQGQFSLLKKKFGNTCGACVNCSTIFGRHVWLIPVIKKKIILEWRRPRRGVSSMNIWHVHREELWFGIGGHFFFFLASSWRLLYGYVLTFFFLFNWVTLSLLFGLLFRDVILATHATSSDVVI
jgi:hypothetical protein